MKVRFIIESEESCENWNVETDEELLAALRSEIDNDPMDYIDAVMSNSDCKITVEEVKPE